LRARVRQLRPPLPVHSVGHRPATHTLKLSVRPSEVACTSAPTPPNRVRARFAPFWAPVIVKLNNVRHRSSPCARMPVTSISRPSRGRKRRKGQGRVLAHVGMSAIGSDGLSSCYSSFLPTWGGGAELSRWRYGGSTIRKNVDQDSRGGVAARWGTRPGLVSIAPARASRMARACACA
jgi:hypothetical protein